MAELNEKQREFCRLIVSGISQRKAYAQAFGCQESTAGQSATKLMKKAYIQEEISRLKAKERSRMLDRERKRDDRAIGSKLDRMELLWGMACDSKDAGNVNEAVNCVRELNRMDGAYEQAEANVQVNVGVSVGDVVAAVMGAK